MIPVGDSYNATIANNPIHRREKICFSSDDNHLLQLINDNQYLDGIQVREVANIDNNQNDITRSLIDSIPKSIKIKSAKTKTKMMVNRRNRIIRNIDTDKKKCAGCTEEKLLRSFRKYNKETQREYFKKYCNTCQSRMRRLNRKMESMTADK
jgi:hypothetical protein